MNRSLDSIVLKTGSHTSADDGLCAMEAVAWLANETHSDRPVCASPVLSAYVRTLNDYMPDDQRQKLKLYVPRLLNTADASLELQRANILAWASVITFAPTALHAVGLVDHAETLRNLKKFDWAGARSAAAKSAESAAKSAKWSAKWSAEAGKKANSIWDLALLALDAAIEVKS